MEDAVAGPLDAISQRAEEILGHAGDALGRVADELPGFARLLRSEPRLRAALTDIARGAEAKKALLDDLMGERLDTRTMEGLGDRARQGGRGGPDGGADRRAATGSAGRRAVSDPRPPGGPRGRGRSGCRGRCARPGRRRAHRRNREEKAATGTRRVDGIRRDMA